MAQHEPLADRLEKLAKNLRAQGLIHGPERDLMIDAANELRAMLDELTRGGR